MEPVTGICVCLTEMGSDFFRYVIHNIQLLLNNFFQLRSKVC